MVEVTTVSTIWFTTISPNCSLKSSTVDTVDACFAMSRTTPGTFVLMVSINTSFTFNPSSTLLLFLIDDSRGNARVMLSKLPDFFRRRTSQPLCFLVEASPQEGVFICNGVRMLVGIRSLLAVCSLFNKTLSFYLLNK